MMGLLIGVGNSHTGNSTVCHQDIAITEPLNRKCSASLSLLECRQAISMLRVLGIVKERNENIDPTTALELAEALAAAERTYAQARLDAEEQIYGHRLKGYERKK